MNPTPTSSAPAPVPLRIDFVSDVVCPWCAIGLAALDAAVQRLGAEVPVEVHFQPFELNPHMAAEGEEVMEHLTRKYGLPPEQLARNRENIRQRGAQEGFTFGERTRIWNTFNAHRLLHWAGLEGKEQQSALKRGLLKAYHTEGRDVSDAAVLCQLAQEAGLDGARAAAILAGDEFGPEVRAQERHWQNLGIQGVPAVIINRRHLVSGGQPSAAFEAALRQVAAMPPEAASA